MKKKFLPILLTVLTVLFCASVFAGCGSGAKLTYNKKYIYSSDVAKEEAQQSYYLFRKNGTGKYQYYYHSSYDTSTESYTITFKYVTTDNGMVHCVFDSIKYDETHNMSKSDKSTWITSAFFSPEILYFDSQYSGNKYICEKYLDDFPNFGKETA